VRQRRFSGAVVMARVEAAIRVVLGSNSEVDDVEDNAQTSGDDQQYTNDDGLTTAVRVDHRWDLVRLTDDINWVYSKPTTASGHHGLLLQLHPPFLYRHTCKVKVK